MRPQSGTTNGEQENIPADGVCPACGRLLLEHPGVRRVLEQRGMDHVPGCQCAEEEKQRAERRRVFANLPHDGALQTPRTFANFKGVPGTDEAIGAARDFAEGKEPYCLLTLIGGTGCGKSHLLEAIGRACLERGVRVKYELVADLLDRLKATFGEDAQLDFEQVASQYMLAQVLLLDDMGMEKGTDWAVERLTSLVDFRIRDGRPLVVATNLTDVQMGRKLGPRLASRLYDAHTGAVRVVWMTSTDYRLQGNS